MHRCDRGGDDVNAGLETHATHPDGIADALQFVDGEFLRSHVEHLTIERNRYRSCRNHDTLKVRFCNLLFQPADGDGTSTVQAAYVVTCDTGPMHLAVAVGTPTFGIFVCTDPKRFGYSESPHQALDAQEGWRADYGIEMKSWLQGVLPQAAEPQER